MKSFNKTLLMTGLSLILAILGQNSLAQAEIKYIDGAGSESGQSQEASKDESPEEVSQSEGIAAEQVIIRISPEGYVSSHGDHYHSFNGEVPFDSIISRELLAPQDYRFNKEDVVTEIDQGYVVEVDGKYYVYYDHPDQAKNLRTKEEISLQAYGLHPQDARKLIQVKEELGLAKDSKISYKTDQTEADLAQEEGKDSQVVYLMANNYVSLIGEQLYIFPGPVPEEAVFNRRLLVPDDYKFKETDKLQDTAEGAIIKLDQTYYLYVKDQQAAKNLSD